MLKELLLCCFTRSVNFSRAMQLAKSRRNISELMDIRPDYANIEVDGEILTQVDPDEVEIGTVIIVQPGEKVPIDGVVSRGKVYP